MNKVFISYSHKQGEWVWERLAPCLKAGGCEVLLDKERFTSGKSVKGQMDAVQDKADRHVLALSPDYLKSDYCQHEMKRALKLDPKFKKGLVAPALLEDCALPSVFTAQDGPVRIDFRDDGQPEPWDQLFQQCGADLGVPAPVWLTARDRIVQFLDRGQSVNLVTRGPAKWRELLDHIADGHCRDLALVNLEAPATTYRGGLLAAILHALGERAPIPPEPYVLAEFGKLIKARGRSRVILTHFDLVPHRPYYDMDLFSTLRNLMEERSLVLLVESRSRFAALLPKDHPFSPMGINTVELGRGVL